MKRLAVMLLCMLITACGGSSETEEESGASAANTTTVDDGSAGGTDQEAQGEEPSADDASVSGVGTATLILDGETYHFGGDVPDITVCEPSYAIVGPDTHFSANLLLLDDSGGVVGPTSGLAILLRLEGVDTGPQSHASFFIEEEAWRANPQDVELGGPDPGTSQVDDYTIDGNTASGSATFYEFNSEHERSLGNADSYLVAQGTFEVTCAG